MITSERCKYCGSPLDEDGYCTRPCTKGASEKAVAEAREAVKAEKEGEAEQA